MLCISRMVLLVGRAGPLEEEGRVVVCFNPNGDGDVSNGVPQCVGVQWQHEGRLPGAL